MAMSIIDLFSIFFLFVIFNESKVNNMYRMTISAKLFLASFFAFLFMFPIFCYLIIIQ
ncbi:hypothetical protein EC835_105301 [Providencia alcalifaciens]|uniref:Uncharacterized protein n=1 Tax=Providencia alcalifaciens TaxID=126385 RepID=A0A4R3NJU7_9GAMM|nr:hypothetical protein EC835_105301 [Providencia alcalifaciens]